MTDGFPQSAAEDFSGGRKSPPTTRRKNERSARRAMSSHSVLFTPLENQMRWLQDFAVVHLHCLFEVFYNVCLFVALSRRDDPRRGNLSHRSCNGTQSCPVSEQKRYIQTEGHVGGCVGLMTVAISKMNNGST